MGQKERKEFRIFQHYRMETLLVYIKHQSIRLLHKVGLHGKVTDLSFCFKLIKYSFLLCLITYIFYPFIEVIKNHMIKLSNEPL